MIVGAARAHMSLRATLHQNKRNVMLLRVLYLLSSIVCGLLKVTLVILIVSFYIIIKKSLDLFQFVSFRTDSPCNLKPPGATALARSFAKKSNLTGFLIHTIFIIGG